MECVWNTFPEEVAQEFSIAVSRTGLTPQLHMALRVLDNMFNNMTVERIEQEMRPIYLEMV